MERAELARLLGAGARAGGAEGEAVFVAERDLGEFMAKFAAAAAGQAPVFLGDPGWSRDQQARWQPQAAATAGGERGWLMIPTGGSGGGLKFVRHDQDTMAAAVAGFCRHFGLSRVNAIGVLPLYHVSGLMAWVRCALTGGEFRPWDWKRLEAGERPGLGPGPWVISLVPTQLQRLLGDEAAITWLRGFEIIFLGGGPVWPELADGAAAAGLRVSLSYGMTETAAMVTALRPEEFIRGVRSSGSPLPHVSVEITADGLIAVTGESVFRGYYPESRAERRFETGDLGRIDAAGHLHVLGRRDAAIITGGKKVQPAEVEAILRASGEFEDVAVIGLPDAEWGEIVVACFPAAGRKPDTARAAQGLPAYQRPKRFVALADWPRTEAGKINRLSLRAIVEKR
jgi:O-succinylbenzoic acid--CoA ligase